MMLSCPSISVCGETDSTAPSEYSAQQTKSGSSIKSKASKIFLAAGVGLIVGTTIHKKRSAKISENKKSEDL